MRPMMHVNEIQTLTSYLRKDDIMLEWGSGGSTTYFPHFVKRYYSIEHDKEWYNKVKSEIPHNVKLYYVNNDFPRTKPTKRKQFKTYIEFIHEIHLDFDKVLIDGRARQWCAREVLPYLNKDSIVFFHDFNRKRYHSILKFYNKIDQVQTLAVLKPKNG